MINTLSRPCLFAQVDAQDLFDRLPKNKVSHHEYLFVIGAMAAVTLAVLLWATFIRKRRRHRKYKYPHASENKDRQKLAPEAVTPEIKKDSKPRRRRRSRRSAERRNPTLAETGGLPPVRNDWPDHEA